MSKAHVTHPELKATFHLDILGVKKNPNGAMYSSLGVITKGGFGLLIVLLRTRHILHVAGQELLGVQCVWREGGGGGHWLWSLSSMTCSQPSVAVGV
jgi:hypothetical protein